LAANRKKNPANMKLFGKKQWIISIIGLIGGLILSGIVLNLYFGEIKYWIIITTGLIGVLVMFTVGRYANK
jgi:cytochrome b subunit of formate dehydrogenase